MIDKAAARRAAIRRRDIAHASQAATADHLIRVLASHPGVPLAGYAPIRSEIDPTSAMTAAAAHGPVGLPVITAKAAALQFRLWQPGAKLIPGTFGTPIPDAGAWMVPEILIVPLLAFTRRGARLGYGGGYYDRTLQHLRASGPVLAIGFAYGAQECADLPLEPTDEPLDMIVTEQGIITP